MEQDLIKLHGHSPNSQSPFVLPPFQLGAPSDTFVLSKRDGGGVGWGGGTAIELNVVKSCKWFQTPFFPWCVCILSPPLSLVKQILQIFETTHHLQNQFIRGENWVNLDAMSRDHFNLAIFSLTLPMIEVECNNLQRKSIEVEGLDYHFKFQRETFCLINNIGYSIQNMGYITCKCY